MIIVFRKSRRFPWLWVLILIGLIYGCAGSAGPSIRKDGVDVPSTGSPVKRTPISDPKPATPVSPPPLEIRIRTAVNQWQGTPHRMGGTSHHGIDCSGFVQRIYRDLFDRSIPRTTSLQARHGKHVDPLELLPGDLVFFRPPQKAGHVGIYLGNEEFAHASTSQGVTISSLNETYWRNCYWTARRYME